MGYSQRAAGGATPAGFLQSSSTKRFDYLRPQKSVKSGGIPGDRDAEKKARAALRSLDREAEEEQTAGGARAIVDGAN